jgi:hypothetical protein
MKELIKMKEGNTSYLDILRSEYENYDNFYSDIAQAYQNIKFNTCKFDFFFKELDFVIIFSDDLLVHSRIILPYFVNELKIKLNCEEKKDDIIAFKDNYLLATKSSSFIDCCKLEIFLSKTGFESSVPYRIESINSSNSEENLLKQGIIPVKWSYYPNWGHNHSINFKGFDGKMRFSIPSSQEQVDLIFNDLLKNVFYHK